MNKLWRLQTFIQDFFPKGQKRRTDGQLSPPSVRTQNLQESCLSVAVVNQDEERKLDAFLQILARPVIDFEELRSASWKGIPEQVRPLCWQILLGYVPCESQYRLQALERKRSRYFELTLSYFKDAAEDESTMMQIDLDIPRTIPRGLEGNCLEDVRLQQIMRRTLYIWSMENEYTTYFQGLTDVCCQMMLVLLSWYVEPSRYSENMLDAQSCSQLEADTYWCFSIFMDGMKHYHTDNLNIGMEAALHRVRDVVETIDEPLLEHFDREGVMMMQFAVRWMLCLLTREFDLSSVSRIWDTYIAEGEHHMSDFHFHLCASLILKFRHQLKQMDFSEALTMLQHLPTQEWKTEETEELIWRACVSREVQRRIQYLCLIGAVTQITALRAMVKMMEQAETITSKKEG
ncbi:RabGAP/TBC domain-containing protein [Planoprotostelium fungivorum]|uniref:RabGAP/TBC domain-containing protein n=1 Tax=Planoprotostelium fungivorum TaxID=1890364 RepID=A0A2P6NSM7_9EUKA|nr:RabGAP/TBC domain-containing protein [Planoprotostelium fungivorum]